MTDTRDTTAARDALNAYCAQRGMIQDPEEDIADLIADLLHLLDQLDPHHAEGANLHVIDRAMLHYNEERD